MSAEKRRFSGKDRLEELERCQILDTLPEKAYDDIVHLVSVICETPIALVSLLDEKRQWFKAKVGIEETETPIELSFCKYAIENPDEIFIVEDAAKDERFQDNYLVTHKPGIRYYIGYPLSTDTGCPLGTLCAIDTKPHQITEKHVNALKVLASNVANLIVLRKLENRNKKLIEKLMESNQELDRFAHLCSHDLKEPIRTMKLFSEKLAVHPEIAGSDDEKIKTYFGFIAEAGERAYALIDDLLAFSSLDQKKAKLEEIDLNLVLETIRQNLWALLESTGGKIISETPLPTIRGKSTQITQVFQNLISNGLKYHSPGASPRVRVSAKDLGERWEFAVSDNGLGIGKRDFSRIFTLFERVHRSREFTGSGIGLAIVKRIVEMNDGEIWLESKKGEGSTFFFTLPK